MAVWAFDCETEDWENYVLGCAVSSDGQEILLNNFEDIRDWYFGLPKGSEVWAHNGGKFDALIMIDALRGYGTMLGTFSGGALSTLWVKGYAQIRDSARLAPMKLEKFAKAFGTQFKEHIGIPCICKDVTKLMEDGITEVAIKASNCGGYCSIRRDMPKKIRNKVVEYCFQDCRSLLSAIDGLYRMADEIGISYRTKFGKPRPTIGGWAWGTIKEWCEIGPQCDTWYDYRLSREGYYGGRNEVHKWESKAGWRYDLRNAYGASMLRALPWGITTHYEGGNKPRKAYNSGSAGSYYVRAFVPDGLPTLPMRIGPRLVWATGFVEGWYYRDELQKAESYGTEILGIKAALVSEKEIPWIAPYIKKISDERLKALDKGEDAKAEWLKLAINAPSGKLAQGGEVFRLAIDVEDESDLPNNSIDLGGKPGKRVWAIPSCVIPDCARPLTAAALTARVRGWLLDRLWLAGESAVYCDTDSTYCEKELPTSEGVGGWVCEGKYEEWLAVAPKMYRFIGYDKKKKKITGIAKAKGVPDATFEEIDLLWRGHKITRDRGLFTIKTAFRKSAGEKAVKKKSISRRSIAPKGAVGTRLRLAGGLTRPLAITQDGMIGWIGNTDPELVKEVLGVDRRE